MDLAKQLLGVRILDKKYAELFNDSKVSLKKVERFLAGVDNVPKTAVPYVHAVLSNQANQPPGGIPATVEQAEQRFGKTTWPKERKLRREDRVRTDEEPTPLPIDARGMAFDRLLTEATSRVKAAQECLRQAARLTNALFAEMGADHFFVSSTSTLDPLIFLGPINSPVWTARAAAHEKGAVAAVIVPSEHARNRLRVYGIPTPDGLRAQFDRYRGLLAGQLGNPETGRAIVDSRIGLFECDDMLFAPPGIAHSLIGWRRGDASRDKPHMRLITRGMFDLLEAPVVWPSTDEGDAERRFRQYAQRVIREAKVPEPTQLGWAVNPEHRRVLKLALLNRLLNKPDDTPLSDKDGELIV